MSTDSTGSANFSTTLSDVSVASGEAVTATATVDLGGGGYGSTSEFATNLLANTTAHVLAGQDTYIQLKNTGLNYGAAASLVVDRESSDLQRALLRFDLSAIPSNATITNAALTMQSTQIGGTLNISVYEMLSAWARRSRQRNGGRGELERKRPRHELGQRWRGLQYDPCREPEHGYHRSAFVEHHVAGAGLGQREQSQPRPDGRQLRRWRQQNRDLRQQ